MERSGARPASHGKSNTEKFKSQMGLVADLSESVETDILYRCFLSSIEVPPEMADLPRGTLKG